MKQSPPSDFQRCTKLIQRQCPTLKQRYTTSEQRCTTLVQRCFNQAQTFVKAILNAVGLVMIMYLQIHE